MSETAENRADWEAESPQIASLRAFLERDYLAQRRTLEALYDRSVPERVAAGSAVAGARFAGTAQDGGQKLYVFSAPRNESRLRPGTRVRVSRGDPRKAAACLELVDDRRQNGAFVFRLAGTLEEGTDFEGPEPWVLDEDVFDLLDVQLSILEAAQTAGLAAWLSGEEEPPRVVPGEWHSPLAEGLEGSSLAAFRGAVGAQPWFAVQGPPGSGKTHLLARLALYYAAEEEKRVLVTAVSHQAIHNALAETFWVGQRLAKDAPKVKELLADGFLKLGGSRGMNEGLPDGVRAMPRPPKNKRPLVAGATVYAGVQAAQGFSRRPFDVVLFDEAGQTPLVLALGARLLAPKAVFIGDDAQLPPVVSSGGEDPGEAARSVLSMVRARYQDPLLLAETRRLNEELCAVVSDCFYEGLLSPTTEARGRRLALKSPSEAPFAEVLDPERSLVFLDVPHKDCRSTCEPEALWAAALAAEAQRCGVPAQDVGIIAPYRAQCNRIRFLLGPGSPVVCSTVDRFQGQEREMILISLTSSQLRYMARLAAFLFDPHRLNVAVSRARTKVVLLGSRAALESAAELADEADPDSPALAGFSAFKRILAAAHPVAGGEKPPRPPAPAPAREARGQAFEPGALVEHPLYGAGRVVSRSVQLIDRRREWVNEIRFADGKVRMVVPRLSEPPMRLVE